MKSRLDEIVDEIVIVTILILRNWNEIQLDSNISYLPLPNPEHFKQRVHAFIFKRSHFYAILYSTIQFLFVVWDSFPH